MKTTNVNKYTYNVFWSEEDGAHIAHCLEFQSISGHGNTPEKAIKECKIAVEASIEWMLEEGEEIPAPLGEKKFSGKLNLRMTPEKHRSVAMRAAEQGVSINQYINSKLG